MDVYEAFLAAVTSATNSLDAGQLEPQEARLIAIAARELAAQMDAAAGKERPPTEI